MAKYETVLKGDFDWYRKRIVNGILKTSSSASLEDKSDFTSQDGKVRCIVRVFERYSAFGDNRVSLTVTLFQDETGDIHLSGITSGGSQAMFFKINTVGEETFLYKLKDVVNNLKEEAETAKTEDKDAQEKTENNEEKSE